MTVFNVTLMMRQISITISIIFFAAFFPLAVFAWDDCPRGESDCAYPGECNRYIDTDNNGICDHSEPAPEDVDEATDNREEEIDSSLSGDARISYSGNGERGDGQSNKSHGRTYHFFSVSLTTIALFFFTFVLSKKKIIKITTHRKIWNVLLLITALISGIYGVLLVVEINQGIKFSLPFNLLYWHVEVGIAMFVVSLLHIIERWRYFKNIFFARAESEK